jgi:ribulose-5-phosphate 4-epimerase/fuculose-1-phosphate aldolase
MSEPEPIQFETEFLDHDPPQAPGNAELLSWCRRFAGLGWVPETAGNLSYLTERGFIITGSGTVLAEIDASQLVRVTAVAVDAKCMRLKAEGRLAPSKESVLHWLVYSARPETRAIFHTHDELVLRAAERLHLPCTAGEQTRGSLELVREVERVLNLHREAEYLCLRNHGVLSLGKTMADAGRAAESMHQTARELMEEESK